MSHAHTSLHMTADASVVIDIHPWNSDAGRAPREPVLRVGTSEGELEITYSLERRKFAVRCLEARFRGMPAGVTLYAHRDERTFQGFASAMEGDIYSDTTRTPQWNVSGYDKRSDNRAVTPTMSRAFDKLAERTAQRCAEAGFLRRLVEVTTQWGRRRRLAELEAELAEKLHEVDGLRAHLRTNPDW